MNCHFRNVPYVPYVPYIYTPYIHRSDSTPKTHTFAKIFILPFHTGNIGNTPRKALNFKLKRVPYGREQIEMFPTFLGTFCSRRCG